MNKSLFNFRIEFRVSLMKRILLEFEVSIGLRLDFIRLIRIVFFVFLFYFVNVFGRIIIVLYFYSLLLNLGCYSDCFLKFFYFKCLVKCLIDGRNVIYI